MKFKVELREVIFTDMEVEAESLEEVKKLIIQAREEAGKITRQETNEFTAKIFHSNGEESVKLL